jgi:hypothetical protein
VTARERYWLPPPLFASEFVDFRGAEADFAMAVRIAWFQKTNIRFINAPWSIGKSSARRGIILRLLATLGE